MSLDRSLLKYTDPSQRPAPWNFIFADATDRASGTGYNTEALSTFAITFTAADVAEAKVALQLDDGSEWVITATTPTWRPRVASDTSKVPTTTTVNGHALTGDVVVTEADVKALFYLREPVTAGFTADADDHSTLKDATANTFTIALTAAATLGNNWKMGVFNSGSGVITIDPDGAETIRDAVGSATTKTLAQGECGIVICDGAGFIFLKIVAAPIVPTLDTLTVHGADIASAATVNLDAATGDLVDVTGTTTITAVTLTEGRWRTVRFTGILTLTHGSSLVLPSGASITTAAGDYAVLRGYAAGVVRCVTYSRASGQAVVGGSTTLDALTIHGADIASAGTVNLETSTGDLVDVTGTTTITAITLSEGHWRTVRFTGALTLTHGSSLLLPGAANITTAAGDFAIFRGYATGVVRCVGYTKANGQAVVVGAGGSGTKTLARWVAQDGLPPTTNFASLSSRNSIPVLNFDASTAESIVFIGIIPEAADFTTGITVRLVWMAATATSGNVIWTSAFERGNTDLDADSFATGNDSAASAANGTSGIITVSTINHSGSEIDGAVAGDLFRLKITRKAADASDTMTGDAQLIAVEIQQR